MVEFSQNLTISKASPVPNDILQGEQVNGDGNDKYEIFESQVCFSLWFSLLLDSSHKVGALKESKLVIQQTKEEDFGTYQVGVWWFCF